MLFYFIKWRLLQVSKKTKSSIKSFRRSKTITLQFQIKGDHNTRGPT